MIVFQVQNVHLQLAIGVFEFIPNAVERISKGTKAVADPGGGSWYLFETKIVITIGLYITV